MLEFPERLAVSFLVNGDAWQAYDRPIVWLYLLEVAAKVVLVESLHDDDDWRIAAVDSVSDGGLESSVHSLSHHVAQRILWLDRVIDDDGSCESVGERVAVFVHSVHLSSSETCNLSERGGCIDASTLLCVPLRLGVASVLDPRFKHRLVCFAVYDVLYGDGVVHCQVAGVGEVYEIGGWIDCESHGDEVLNRQLGLAVSWCDVDDELVAFALQHLIQRIAYSLVVVSDNKPLASVLLEEVPSEVEGVLQYPHLLQFGVVHHASTPPPASSNMRFAPPW